MTLESPAATKGTVPARALLVDDNVDAAESLGLLLRSWEYVVDVATNGPQAIETFRVHRPRIVLWGIGLSGMDGYQSARQLRAEAGPACFRLIALTGYGQENDRQRGAEAGFDEHLVKPINPEQLRSLIATALKG